MKRSLGKQLSGRLVIGALLLGATGCSVEPERQEEAPDSRKDAGADERDARAVDDDASTAQPPDEAKDASMPPTMADAGPTVGDVVEVFGSDDGGIPVVAPLDAGADAGNANEPISLTGQLRLSSRLFLDADVANQDVLVGSNDRIDRLDPAQDEAQPITSPSTTIGYLGPAVPTESGDTRADNVDYYKVQLQQGQVVTLYVSEPAEPEAERADLDLFLYGEAAEGTTTDALDDFVADDQGVGDKEVVVAPTTGTYWVAVERYQDPDDDGSADDDAALGAVYTLTVGVRAPEDVLVAAAMDRVSSSLPIVPGSALVELEAGATLNTAPLGGRRFSLTKARSGRFARVRFETTRASVPSARRTQTEREARQETIRAIKRLARQRGVRKAIPEYLYSYKTAPDDPLYPQQWHYPQIDLEQAWETTDAIDGSARGEGVIVAVIDTGIVAEHPDFTNSDGSSQLVAGKDLVSLYGQEQGGEALPDLAADGDGYDSEPHDPGDGRSPGDHSYHGTHCAGTVAAATSNREGGAGVAPNARIMPVRAVGRGGGISLDIAEAIRWAAGLTNATGSVPERRADVISMSLGGPRSAVFADAVAAARAAGVIVIAAAGNERSPVEFVGPAAEDGVVAVSATDFNRELAFYSNSGGLIDVAAPGGDTQADENLDGLGDGVLSAVFKNNGKTRYVAYQGTSMAAPHVAGVAALMKSVWKAMTPDDFDRVLPEITVDIGDAGRDASFGHGLINANRAVLVAAREAQIDVTSSPVLSVSTTVLDFGGGDNDLLPLTISNTGDQESELELLTLTTSADWLSIAPGVVGENAVTVDRDHASLAPGVNVGSIYIETNGGEVSVDVRVFLGEEPTGGDIDLVYVMLVDPDTGVVRRAEDQVIAFRDEPTFTPDYGFSFSDVQPGRYYLVAGTDLADTFYLGNDGNAYGAFPLAQDPQILCVLTEDAVGSCKHLVTKSESNLDFNLQVLIDQGAEREDDGEVANASFGSYDLAAVKARRAW